MNNLFWSINFNEENLMKLSQINKGTFIRCIEKYEWSIRSEQQDKKNIKTARIQDVEQFRNIKSHDLCKYSFNNYKKIREIYKKKKIITLLLIMLKEYEPNINWLLQVACEVGDINLVNLMISKGADDYFGDGLYEACAGGYSDIIDLLLQIYFTSNNNIVCSNYLNAGLEGACYGGYKDLIYLMIDFLEKRQKNPKWDEAFYGACEGGHIDIAYLTIDMLEKYQKIPDWNRGLYWACRGGHKEIVDIIISKGANNWHWGMGGACEGPSSHNRIEEESNKSYKERQEIIDLMINKGATHCPHCDLKLYDHCIF